MNKTTEEDWVYFGRVGVNLAKLNPNRPRLDSDEKKAWIDALWFGFYTQGKNVLCDKDNNFCCLGVKHVIEGDLSGSILRQTDYFGFSKNILGPTGTFGDYDRPVVLLNDSPEISLAMLNDSGATFREIAFVIEQVF